MRHDRPTQSVGVVLNLVGTQDVAAGVHLPMTEDAAVSVRVGTALIYMHDPATVEKFVNSLYDLARDSRRLPREHAADVVAPIEGMTEPAVVANAFSGVRASGRLVSVPGSPSYLRLQLGRLVFHMRDLSAYSSTAAVFREAASLAPTTFRSAGWTFRRQTAVQDAAAAFPKVRARSRHAPHSRDPRAARSTNPPSVPRPTRWME